MGLDEFKTYPKWIRALKGKAETCDLDFFAESVNPRREDQSYLFEVSSETAAVIGKTHNTNKYDQRIENHIELVYNSEKEFISLKSEVLSNEDQYDEIEILAIVINHSSEGQYNPETDDFLVLDEQILQEEVPSSNQKKFRDDTDGYPPPFHNHINDWERIFELFDC